MSCAAAALACYFILDYWLKSKNEYAGALRDVRTPAVAVNSPTGIPTLLTLYTCGNLSPLLRVRAARNQRASNLRNVHTLARNNACSIM